MFCSYAEVKTAKGKLLFVSFNIIIVKNYYFSGDFGISKKQKFYWFTGIALFCQLWQMKISYRWVTEFVVTDFDWICAKLELCFSLLHQKLFSLHHFVSSAKSFSFSFFYGHEIHDCSKSAIVNFVVCNFWIFWQFWKHFY